MNVWQTEGCVYRYGRYVYMQIVGMIEMKEFMQEDAGMYCRLKDVSTSDETLGMHKFM